VNWILDADIRAFFDGLSHEWLIKFIEHRIADRRVLRLIQKWLRAGVSEEGKWSKTEVGTPQGAVASPLLANIYLHYVFDLWISTGENITRRARWSSSVTRMISSWDSNIAPTRSVFSRNGRSACRSSGWSYTRTRRA
jgi:retron-type reverse transcriptase